MTDAYAWWDELLPAIRPTRRWTAYDETPNVTDVPVPGDPVICQTDPELWFGGGGVKDQRKAAEQCRWCWLRDDCMEYGLAHPELDGVWGGLTQHERRGGTKPPAKKYRPVVVRPVTKQALLDSTAWFAASQEDGSMVLWQE